MHPHTLLQLVLPLLHVVHAVYDPDSTSNTVVYWGQTGGGPKASLATTCASGADVVVLSFLTTFFGPGGLPALNFASHCGETFPGSSLLKCDAIAKDIQTCQDAGTLVLLSLGGAIADVGFTSDAQATAFGDQLWNLFGGGTATTRPFGKVVLDGFDLDIENGSPLHYTPFVKQLQKRFAADKSKRFYMAAAPQCVFPDAMLGEVLDAAPFDMVLVQHYNNPGCAIANEQGFNGATWQRWAKTSPNPHVKVFLGVPAAPAAAGSGYVEADKIAGALQGLRQTFGEERLGGVMFWDASFLGLPNPSNFASQVKACIGGDMDANKAIKAQVPLQQAQDAMPTDVPVAPAVIAPAPLATTLVYVAGIGPAPSPASAANDNHGGACSIEGQMQCRPSGAFATCNHGAWVVRACAPGTLCRPEGESIVCDFTETVLALKAAAAGQQQQQVGRRRVKRGSVRAHVHRQD